MSRQRSRQERASKREPLPQDRATSSFGVEGAALPAWASTRRTVIYAIVALILSAIFTYQITREDSMLGGIMGWELEKLNSEKPGQITWKDLGEEYRREAVQMPGYKEHEAVRQLLIVVDYVNRGRLDAGRVLDQAKIWAAEDSDNLVSRLALAYLTDRAQGGAKTTSQQQFENAKKIIDGDKPAKQATLHQDAFNRKWNEVLKRHIKREDVAVSAARHVRVEEQRQIAALPVIGSWLVDMTRELRSSGHPEEAKFVAECFVDTFQNIADSESDSATGLLVASVLVSGLPANSPMRAHFEGVRKKFHESSDAAPIDPIDIYKCPTVFDPFKFVTLIVCPAAAASVGIGALICVIFSIIGSKFFGTSVLLNEDSFSSKSIQRATLFLLPIIVILPAALANDAGFLNRGIISQSGLIISFMFWALYGALFPIGCAAYLLGKKRDGLRLTILFCIIVIAMLPLLPSRYWLTTIRALDLHGGSILYAAAILLLISLILFAWTSQSSRLIPYFAARVFLWSMIWAVVGLQIAKSAEQFYLRQYHWRWNEVALRYGENWNTRHFSSSQDNSTTQP